MTAAEKVEFVSPWTLEEWLCRGDVVKNEQLLLVRANMEPFRSHPFHNHPTREELIYIIAGRAEQWVGKEHRILGPAKWPSSRWAKFTAPIILLTSGWCSSPFFRRATRRSQASWILDRGTVGVAAQRFSARDVMRKTPTCRQHTAGASARALHEQAAGGTL